MEVVPRRPRSHRLHFLSFYIVEYQDGKKGGLSFKGAAFMTVLARSRRFWRAPCPPVAYPEPRGNHDGFGGFGGCSGFGRDGYPP